jgi:polar amino acid transport system substrate-binding protein/glutamate/aspartate transport system substrate-binding protein
MIRIVVAALAALVVFVGSAAAQGTLDRVKATGVFKIGYRTDAPPYSFKSAVDEPAGYSVVLCRSVAVAIKEQLRLDRLSIEYVPVTAENRFDMVQSGAVDLLCGATTATLARREIVDFSIPTFVDGAGVLLRRDGPKSFAELAGRKVGVRAGTTTETALRNTIKAASMTVETVPVADHRDGIARLLNGEIAGYFADRAILFYLMLGTGAADRLHLAEQQLSYEPYALALRKGDGDFRLAVDRALSRLYRSGAITTIFQSSFGANASPSAELRALYRVNALPE